MGTHSVSTDVGEVDSSPVDVGVGEEGSVIETSEHHQYLVDLDDREKSVS